MRLAHEMENERLVECHVDVVAANEFESDARVPCAPIHEPPAIDWAHVPVHAVVSVANHSVTAFA
jgi:hypothetical protein